MKLHHGELKYMTAMKVMLAGSEINLRYLSLECL